jgi:hypothetical protein
VSGGQSIFVIGYCISVADRFLSALSQGCGKV